ncbi:RHS repeat-associated core domain-containing protein [Mucilaginibacter sp. 10B2]|uniref:RHS repeat domain-containing protein n=1 Tax=Mucilaginibacter sp. 10B2 TaxID=3048574 RepID=UPI002B22EDEF|nr:RHS repeat-associated core domain-containing protein [Mucilaginibacter sp. 10B2]MEB0280528.1 RHS repeat-associated core domain-containing protein [Mucilaginibacter sp. 10B2]
MNNHLGNLMVTISDRQVKDPTGANDFMSPDVINAQDYYPFGMPQPGRQYALSGSYRYGFNGKENDNDVGKGNGVQQDYGMRIYDDRIGRFLSLDPLSKSFPFFSPYQFSGNNPLEFIDLDGAEPQKKTTNYGKNVMIGLVNVSSLDNSYNKKLFGVSNNNWLGIYGSVEDGEEYINSLKNDMLSTTKLTTVVLMSHGGKVGLNSNPIDKGSTGIGAKDINNYLDGNTSVLFDYDGRKDFVVGLQKIFNGMADKGASLIISACNVGTDDEFGKALQRLSNYKVDIYLTPDRVTIYDPDNKDTKIFGNIPELGLPRIQDGRKHGPFKWDISNLRSGFRKFPANNGSPEDINSNITLNQSGAPVSINKISN